MITQKLVDQAKSQLRVSSSFNWEDDPAHPDFGAQRNVCRRESLANLARCRHPLFGRIYLRAPEALAFSTAVNLDLWDSIARSARGSLDSAKAQIERKLDQHVGADFIEDRGAYFSEESDETVQALLRKCGVPNGKLHIRWSLHWGWVKYKEEPDPVRLERPIPGHVEESSQSTESSSRDSALLTGLFLSLFIVVVFAAALSGGVK